jgi:LiaF transmembrane domain
MTITESSAPRIRLTSQLFAGLLIAALGVLFTLDNLNILRARDVLRYWPAILIVIGVSQLAQARTIGTMIGGSIWIVFGAVLLGERLHLITAGLRFWPLLLVAVGAWIVVRSMTAAGPSGVTDSSARLSALAVLGGVDRRVTAEGFQGADITAFMGGGKLDLREAKIAGPEAVVDILAVMGGFEIVAPETWHVIVDVVPLMGGYEDKTRHPADPSAPRLRLRGFVMMGGLEVRN